MTDQSKRTFYTLLGNTFIATITNTFIWFAITFWVFLETESVLATSWVGGTFAILSMVSALFFGNIVDRNKKKTAMMYSSIASLIMYVLGALVYFTTDPAVFKNLAAPQLWLLILTLIMGSVAGNLRTIALSTTVSMLFTEGRDKANGLIGAVNGVSFAFTSVLSGLAIGFVGMHLAITVAVVATFLCLIHLIFVTLPEAAIIETAETPKRLDLRGTIAAITLIPGLFALIFFTTFNNFLGGVFMALMDAYGLTLMSVEAWGIMLGILSAGFIAGHSFIAKFGLGKNPLRRMLLINLITWTTCIFFTIQPSIILLGLGMLIWMSLMPFVEACEQTVIQRVVPFERQGRVFGFAQSIESTATPVTAFLIGPIAQFLFIPFMTTGAGVTLIGDWFGVGMGRGIALVFMLAGVLGLIVTIFALRSRAYKTLSHHYESVPPAVPLQPTAT